jgi:hypothetical protein
MEKAFYWSATIQSKIHLFHLKKEKIFQQLFKEMNTRETLKLANRTRKFI